MTSNVFIVFRAADEDSEDALVTFTMEQPYSTVGVMVLHNNLPDDLRGWTNMGDYWEKRVTKWTQSDIDKGMYSDTVSYNIFIINIVYLREQP